MNELFSDSVFFGLFLSLFTYWIGVKIKARFQWTLLNPLLIAIVLCIVCLVAGDISYETFNQAPSICRIYSRRPPSAWRCPCTGR